MIDCIMVCVLLCVFAECFDAVLLLLMDGSSL